MKIPTIAAIQVETWKRPSQSVFFSSPAIVVGGNHLGW
jgi:hypothetical protein